MEGRLPQLSGHCQIDKEDFKSLRQSIENKLGRGRAAGPGTSQHMIEAARDYEGVGYRAGASDNRLAGMPPFFFVDGALYLAWGGSLQRFGETGLWTFPGDRAQSRWNRWRFLWGTTNRRLIFSRKVEQRNGPGRRNNGTSLSGELCRLSSFDLKSERFRLLKPLLSSRTRPDRGLVIEPSCEPHGAGTDGEINGVEIVEAAMRSRVPTNRSAICSRFPSDWLSRRRSSS